MWSIRRLSVEMMIVMMKYILIDIVADVSEGPPLDDADHDPGAVVHQPCDLLALPLVCEHSAYVTWKKKCGLD